MDQEQQQAQGPATKTVAGFSRTVSPLFEVHMLNEPGKAKARAIAVCFNDLLEDLEIVCGNGREMSIVRTKLEEACFFAKKGMANQVENQT